MANGKKAEKKIAENFPHTRHTPLAYNDTKSNFSLIANILVRNFFYS